MNVAVYIRMHRSESNPNPRIINRIFYKKSSFFRYLRSEIRADSALSGQEGRECLSSGQAGAASGWGRGFTSGRGLRSRRRGPGAPTDSRRVARRPRERFGASLMLATLSCTDREAHKDTACGVSGRREGKRTERIGIIKAPRREVLHFGELSHEAVATYKGRPSLPGNRQPLLVNRVGWAMTHMMRADLLERPRRGASSITAWAYATGLSMQCDTTTRQKPN